MVAKIHDRMLLILAPVDCMRWLSDEPDPHDLMRPCPARADAHVTDINTVNKPENDDDDPSILEPIEVATSAAETNGTPYGFGEVRVATSAKVHRRYLQIFRCLFLRTSHSIWQTRKS
jgi:hypothetical protein